MAEMIDPTQALISIQEAIEKGYIDLERGRVNHDLHFYHDTIPDGDPRFTYVRLRRGIVTAFTAFVLADRVNGLPCLQVGYAVPEEFRNKGLAKGLVSAGIVELQNGFSRRPPFYVEAIVGVDNVASQRVAAAVFAVEPTAVTDHVSGLPALHYMRKFDTLDHKAR